MKKLLVSLAIIMTLATASQADTFSKVKIVGGVAITFVIAVGTTASAPIWVPIGAAGVSIAYAVGNKELDVFCKDTSIIDEDTLLTQNVLCQ